MKTKQKCNKILCKVSDIIINNSKNHCFTDINVLIFKHLLENIKTLETNKDNRKFLLKKIDNYLSTPQEILHYTNVLDLTDLSKQVIKEIYADFGFKGCINYYLIKQYFKENNINYDLFLNQVDEVEKIIATDSFEELSGKAIALATIDDIEINLYLNEEVDLPIVG